MHRLYGRGRCRAAEAECVSHAHARRQSRAGGVRREDAQGRDERGAARLGDQCGLDLLLHRHHRGSASVSDDGARFSVDHRPRDARADARGRRPAAGFACRLHRRRLERDGAVPSVSRRPRHRDLRGRGGRSRHRQRHARSLDRRRTAGRAAWQSHISADERGRPDQRGAFDFRRPRLSGYRPRACLAQRCRPRHVSFGDRRRGPARLSASLQARRHHSGAGAGARYRQGLGHRAEQAEGLPDGRQSLRPWRQGSPPRRQPPARRSPMTTRIDRRFAALKEEGRAALVTFVMGGDPDYETSLAIVKALPGAGADMIEIGMPFTDPMADGPAIQAAGLRALQSGQTMKRTLSLVREFRRTDDATPIVLMGYYNPIYIYGVDQFLVDAGAAVVDGLIVVDLPPEEDPELCLPALKAGFNFIRLATPTTDDKRLPAVLANTSGFVYYVSITGITGAAAPDAGKVTEAVARIKRHSALPVCVGFGVRTAEQARVFAQSADGVVVGSALIEIVRKHLGTDGRPAPGTAEAVADLVRTLASGVQSARRVPA